MIGTLEEQMELSANSEEYHRAAMIKDRIREIREEMEKIEKTGENSHKGDLMF